MLDVDLIHCILLYVDRVQGGRSKPEAPIPCSLTSQVGQGILTGLDPQPYTSEYQCRICF